MKNNPDKEAYCFIISPEPSHRLIRWAKNEKKDKQPSHKTRPIHRSSSSGQLPSSRRICKHGPKGFFSLRRSFVHSHKSSSQESADATPTSYFVASAESGGPKLKTLASPGRGDGRHARARPSGHAFQQVALREAVAAYHSSIATAT